jgi:hypothetical protein
MNERDDYLQQAAMVGCAEDQMPQRHGNAIHALLNRHNLVAKELKRFVAGADVFSKQSDGTTVAEQYGRQGLALRAANMDRVNGWAEVLHRLGDPDEGVKPTLFIHRRCKRLLECLPALQHDPHRPEDVLKVDADDDGVGGDDAADTLRYLVATKTRELVQRRLRGV